MKKFGILLLIMILPTMLFARGAQETSENYIRFAWWGNPTRDERTEAVVRLFEQRNPGVIIETEPTNWAGYWDRMATLAAANNLPDVMQQDVSYIRQYNERNQLEDLAPFARRGLINLNYWDDAGLGAGRIGGRLVGLLLGTNAWGFVIDPAVLQRAGVTFDDTTWTWADYERIALQIFERTGVQTDPSQTMRQAIEHIGRQFGRPCFTEDRGHPLGITASQPAQNAVRDYIDMHLRLLSAGALFNPQEGFIQGLAMPEQILPRGQTWNQTGWSNQFAGLQSAANRPAQFVMFPSVAGNRAPFGTYLRASMYISMLSSSQNKDLAARFIDFFSNDIEGNRILMGERGVPIPTNVRADLHGRVDANSRHIFDYITKVTPLSSPADPPYPPGAGEVETLTRNLMLETLMGRIPNATASVQQLIQQSNAVMARENP